MAFDGVDRVRRSRTRTARIRRGPKSVLGLLGLILLAAALLQAPALAQQNLIVNPDFEEGIDESTGLPAGWTLFSGEAGVHLIVTPDPEGENHIFTINDDSTTKGYGIRSVILPAEPGESYRATVMVRTENGGRGFLYLDFWNERRTRIQAQTASTNNPDWTQLTTALTAPEGTRWVSVILYSTTADSGIAHFDNVTLHKVDSSLWTEDDMNASVGDDQLDYAPADGSVVTTNPPAFIWVPVAGAASYTLEYSTDPEFSEESTTRVTGIDMSVFTPSVTLDPSKTWYWRVFAVDSAGRSSPPSATRAFTISPEAAEMPLPDLAEVRARIPQGHPRLFVTPDTLEDVRAQRRSNMLLRVLADQIINRARTLVFAPLPQEPPHPSPGGVWDVNLWRQYSITVRATEDMTTLAFAYLLTGDESFAEAARRLMLHIASWDPKGATSAAANDESSMPILYQMSRAYTWLYDYLSPEDREVIRNVMRIRGDEAYQILKRRPFESRPYGSHAGRSLGFLGELAIAFLGEIPEAEEWFDYIVRIFYSVYPAWGKDAGGWAEGHAYWTSYMNRVLWFVDALKVATGLDLYEKPFFRNTGTFKLYTHPPYSKIGPFGDFADRGPVTADGNVMSHFAAVYENPYYKWYADQLGAVAETGVMGFIRAYLYPRAHIQGKAPTDLADSAYFPDVGWVVFHKDFGNRNDSIQFMFKSSPYGSFSHSLADQNTFTLEAYEEPLAISSGYRPWYGSTHHMQWTKTTQAHNGLLVSGQGQIVQSLAAKGTITGFLHGESFDYTAGEAAQAYGKLLDEYRRHVVYLRPDVFILYDDVKAPQPETYSWLLHAYHPFEVDEAQGRIAVAAPKARLDVHLWASDRLSYSQTDEFAVPLDEPMDKPTQWHLTAVTGTPSTTAQFLAVLVPSRAGEARELQAERLPVSGGDGVVIADATGQTTVLFGTEKGALAAEGLSAHGRVAAWKAAAPQENGASQEGLLLVEGTEWEAGSGLRFAATVAVDAELTFTYEAGKIHANGTIVAPAGPGSTDFEVRMRLPAEERITRVESTHQVLDWRYEGDELILHLAPGTHRVTLE